MEYQNNNSPFVFLNIFTFNDNALNLCPCFFYILAILSEKEDTLKINQGIHAATFTRN